MKLTNPGQLVEVLGIPFSDQQLAAITAPLEPAVIIAGAGSGKTTVMAARVVWLVGSGQVRPEQVLGLTFTRKAAGELGARVRRALIEAGVLANDAEAGEELILTYDAFAARLVAEHGLRLGIEGDSRLITGAARFRLASRIVADAPGLGKLARLRPTSLTLRVLELAAELRSHLVDPAELPGQAAAFAAALDQAPLNPSGQQYASVQTARAALAERLELAELVVRYEQLKADLGYVEFADQMAAAARLATEVPAVPRALREEFAVVLLDEYQDTSAAQASLLRGLFSGLEPSSGRGHPVTAVGDPCQAIYGWRGAAASNILEFAQHFPQGDGSAARSYALTVNRRSGQAILDAANRLAGPVRAEPMLAGHGLDLDLIAPAGTPPGQVEVAAYSTWPQEASAIADRVAELQLAGRIDEWSQVAVLARRNSQVAAVYAELVARDIPAEIVGLGGLLELPAVAEVVATLTLLQDATANPSVIRLLTSPRWAIGIPDLARLGRRARELALARDEGGAERSDLHDSVGGDQARIPSLLEAVTDPGETPFSPQARQRFAAFASELGLLRRHAGGAVTELVQRVISALGLVVELESIGLGGSAPLATFVQAVANYTDIDADASLSGLLAYLEAEREYGNGLEQAVVSAENSVKVLTVHKAKGLEWEVVFLPGLATDVFPTDRVTGNWLRNSAVLPYPLRGDANALPQLGRADNKSLTAFAADLTEQQRRSEDRLAYVAVTRARRLLVASTHTWGLGLVKPRQPSSYFNSLCEDSQVVHPAPEIPAENPLLAEETAAAWPTAGSGAAFEARRELAEAVAVSRSSAVDAVTSDGGLPEAESELESPAAPRDVATGEAELVSVRSAGGADQSHLVPALPGLELDTDFEAGGPGGSPPDERGGPGSRSDRVQAAASWESLPSTEPATDLDQLEQLRQWQRRAHALLMAEQRTRAANQTTALPEYLSVTGLGRLVREPANFAAELRRPMPRLVSESQRWGIGFHQWLEQRFADRATLVRDEPPAELAGAEFERLQAGFEAGPYADLVPLAIETPFTLVLGDRLIRGRIDAVFPGEAGRVQVVDWKTGDARRSDPLQLSCYRLAWAELNGLDPAQVDAVFYDLHRAEVVRPKLLLGRADLVAVVDRLPGSVSLSQ